MKVTVLTMSRGITQPRVVRPENKNPHAHVNLASNECTKFKVTQIKTVGGVIQKWPKITIFTISRGITQPRVVRHVN